MKKERYFALESIEIKSREMLCDIETLRKKHPLKPSPERAALLVLDMQRYFIDESSHAFVPTAQDIVPGIARLIDTCAKKGVPIIYTRHLNSDADAGMMSVWWRDLIKPDAPSSEIVADFDLAQGLVVEKTQYDAFHKTRLEEILREKGVSQVVICGVMTHLCCETTARSAFVRGFEVIFAIDGTATYNEPFHRATLWNMAHGFAVPMLIEEIVDNLTIDG
ncbi:MAG: isochorismatase family protein [Chloroflexi bacterium]|jgi:bifunctional isochorismate lyase / aryl carrier protein|nr:isochorismatase family protein [Chloroflexota bacterium]